MWSFYKEMHDLTHSVWRVGGSVSLRALKGQCLAIEPTVPTGTLGGKKKDKGE
jgi:hypothetical protein